MKILLIQPPPHPESIVAGGLLEPLALEVLAGALSGHDVAIIDMRFERNLERQLEKFKPACVGVTAISIDVPRALEILRVVHKFDSKIVRVIGGHHATLMPQDFDETTVDYVVIGPGEQTFKELCDALEKTKDPSSIQGLAFWKNGKLIFTQERDISNRMSYMPRPRRNLTDKYRKNYRLFGFLPTALMITSQGCPYQCIFCALWKINKGKYLMRLPGEVVSEIESIKESNIFLGDDNTFGDSERMLEIYNIIMQKGIKKTYFAYARADSIVRRPDMIENWSKIGLKAIVVGFESVEDKELDKLNKKSSVSVNDRANEILLQYGIDNWAHFIMMPHYQKNDFNKIWNYIDSRQIINIAFPFYTPLPGTDLYKKERDRLITNEYQFFDLGHPVVPTRLGLRSYYEEVENLIRKTYSLKRYCKAAFLGKKRNPLLLYFYIPFMLGRLRPLIQRFIDRYEKIKLP